MRDPDRIKPTLQKLEAFWNEHPDMRLGQLIMVIAKTGETNPKLFQLEEPEFLKRLEEVREQLKKN
jgi:uncharacterized protein YihD (DUF1040 family)